MQFTIIAFQTKFKFEFPAGHVFANEAFDGSNASFGLAAAFLQQHI